MYSFRKWCTRFGNSSVGNRPDLTAVRVVGAIPAVCIVGARMIPILQLSRVPVIVAAVNVLNYRCRRRGCCGRLRLLATCQTQCHQRNGGKKPVRVWLHVVNPFSVAITPSRCVAVLHFQASETGTRVPSPAHLSHALRNDAIILGQASRFSTQGRGEDRRQLHALLPRDPARRDMEVMLG